MAVILETSLGDLTVDLYTDERPKCCENFLKLCKIKYYNWCLFHSVQRNLVAQTGDPSGSGRGGASIYAKLYGDQATFFDVENKPRIKHKKLGTLSMVNNGSNMHGSQFFITLSPDIDYLDGTHTVFGEVAEGFEVLEKLNETYVDPDHRPYKDIRIYHTVVLDDPFDDANGLEEYIPAESPRLTQEQLESDRIGAEEDFDKNKGKTEVEINEELSAKEAKANAQLLEMVGDLPEADVNPEDNVLFVCKLNPVTTAEDLEIIFSRFGTILSCEVIKDQKTGESLQYAFIEFENSEQCENAYFKMDNVLIDERRIHVDFSQSVAKLKNKYYRGQGVDMKNQYVIKGSRKEKTQGSGYELVFSDDDADAKKGSKKHKKEKRQKTKRRNSSDYEETREGIKRSRRDNERNVRRRSVSDSPRRNRHDNRSPSPYQRKRRSPDRREEKRYFDRSNDRRDNDDRNEERKKSKKNHKRRERSVSGERESYHSGKKHKKDKRR